MDSRSNYNLIQRIKMDKDLLFQNLSKKKDVIIIDMDLFDSYEVIEESNLIIYRRNKSIPKSDYKELLEDTKDTIKDFIDWTKKIVQKAKNGLYELYYCKKNGIMTFKEFSKEYTTNPDFRRKYKGGNHAKRNNNDGQRRK